MAQAEGRTLIITIPGSEIHVRGNPDKNVPDAEIRGTTFMTWTMRRNVGSASQRETPDGSVTDMNRMVDALVMEWAAQEPIRGKIQSHDGDLIGFEPSTIPFHAHEEAVAFVALELGTWFFPDIFAPTAGADESADPNAEDGEEASALSTASSRST
jgi:hypothetical protein